MYSKIISGTALGIDGLLVSVETDISQGLPGLSLVGYLASSVKEAGERVRTALRNSGFFLPPSKITVNLSPADIKKDGTGYDLAIAVGILISMGKLVLNEEMNKEIASTLFIGELGLDGNVLPIKGVLPIVDYAAKMGIRNVVLPNENKEEASFVKNVNLFPVESMPELINILYSGRWPEPYIPSEENEISVTTLDDLSDIKGQELMKQGVMVAVAGFHNIIMTGAAGAGKSMIAKCIPGLMPALSYEESMELTKIYSVAGLLDSHMRFIGRRPFRSPSQNISQTAMIGGGSFPKPGEVSLANSGVLFLDEFPEFSRNVLESLRQPMEDKKVSISRVKGSYTFPAKFMLVSARNNCPCGFYPDRSKCRCNAGEIFRYQSRISHPIMDRIDIRLEVKRVSFGELFTEESGMSTIEAKGIIMNARERQKYRYRNESFSYNSEVPQGMINEYIKLTDREHQILKEIFEEQDMSARGYFRLLKLIRTIADINDREEIKLTDIEEAVFFRNESQTKGDFV